MLNLATRTLAHWLNMPEPLVHTTGVFVFAHQPPPKPKGDCHDPSIPVSAPRHPG
jgi:hypothetical protein